ncbi:protein IQ-DOMAIN 13-like [Amaranthus tricolor]|uniref:protein IQ-DOMAIN 13-like n=1 Tax=Amaranthus tricolor TaxID=29722 RepID=UPI00258B92AC|nr:protein IQ-DOMAIN 13-like [Amaranthus tricolor]XP_057525570.1 protein IQ-DOMAIN 13-like [Amaranthus tricolor]
MGKKGSWFSAIKRVFTHSSKEKVADETEKQNSKEKKKKGLGKLKHGERPSFFPFVKEPSSIEKILGDVEREHQITDYEPPTPPLKLKSVVPHVTPPKRASTPPKAPTPPRMASLPREVVHPTPPSRDAPQPTPLKEPSPLARRVGSPTSVVTPVNDATPARIPSSRFVQHRKWEPSLVDQHASATVIQAFYRGYMARRSFRAIRGLARLQVVMKGHSVQRQTENTLKCMQLLVRVQNQIQSRRIQMLESQVLQRRAMYKNDQDLASSFGKWMSENHEEWDASTLSKEEREARMKRKFDAIVKRERAMSYAYSHQVCKATPRMANGALADFQSGGYPYWWNWLEQHQVPPSTPTIHPRSPAIKNFLATPTRSMSNFKASPFHQSRNLSGLGFDNMDTPTPRSTRSSVAPRSRQANTPPSRFQQKYSRGSAATSPFNRKTFKDDDSHMSCPPFSLPRYMFPTVSANAKLKGIPDSPKSVADEPRRRMSFPLTQGKETSSPSALGKTQSVQSIGNLSVDSSVSTSANVGRKPFNRFA